jgi:hypothetical protein
MGRENNGVPSRVTHNAGAGSENRGGSQAGKMGQEGGLTPVGGEQNESLVSQNMAAITGAKGSRGTEKDNGGVGTMGGGTEPEGYFGDKP